MNRRFLDNASPIRIHALFGLFPQALADLLAVVLLVLVARRRQAPESRPDRKRKVGGTETASGPLSGSAADADLPAAQRLPCGGGESVWGEC